MVLTWVKHKHKERNRPLEDTILQFIRDHHLWTYPIIMAWTFIEGETIVILCAATAGELRIPVELLALTAFCGSFLGDQTYYSIGRAYGTPLLARWPKLEHRIEWAFDLVHNHPVSFILSFRFIYGIRNFAPFVIGIADVPRMQFLILNFIAAQIWAHSFAWGGYYLGQTLDHFMGNAKWAFLGGFLVVILLAVGIGYLRQRAKQKRETFILAEKALEPGEQATPKPDAVI